MSDKPRIVDGIRWLAAKAGLAKECRARAINAEREAARLRSGLEMSERHRLAAEREGANTPPASLLQDAAEEAR